MEWFVWLLNFLDPHVQLVQLLINQILEVIRSVKDTIDTTHEEWKEDKSYKL